MSLRFGQLQHDICAIIQLPPGYLRKPHFFLAVTVCRNANTYPRLITTAALTKWRTIRWMQTRVEIYQPFVPPAPSSLPTKPLTPKFPLLRRLSRWLLYVWGALGTVYLTDREFNYSTLARSVRGIFTCALVAADYKINFSSHKTSKQLSLLHERNADRIVDLCLKNGGLYQKIGQAIAMQSALLPEEFQAKFSLFFYETPQAPLSAVEKVLKEEYTHIKDPLEELFVPGTFSKRALGSASVAQVHKAQLRDTGEWVAVKVQKPGIRRQVGWDLAVFRFTMEMFSKRMFGIPLGFVAPYISERLQSETNFKIEAENAEQTRRHVLNEFEGSVYVPKIYHELTTPRVMVAEWIDGVTLTQRELLTGPWRGPEWVGKPIPGRVGDRRYGLGISTKEVMENLIEVFAKMMFWWGSIHCDPHPGNIIIRRKPDGKPESVLLDHGLYVHLPPKLRNQYAELWTSLLTFDDSKIVEITEQWGFGNPEMFASATLLRPYKGSLGVGLGKSEKAEVQGADGQKVTQYEEELTPYEKQMKMKEAMSQALENQEKVPKELVFLGRCMRILQANNQLLNSPVNRLKIIAISASRSLLPTSPNGLLVLASAPGSDVSSITRYIKSIISYWRYAVFRIVLFGLDVGFYLTKLKQMIFGGLGFEEELEERMRRVAKEEFGMEIRGGVFQG